MSKKIDSLEDEINIVMRRYDVFGTIINRMLAASDILQELFDDEYIKYNGN